MNIRPIRFFLSAFVALLSTSVPVIEAVAEPVAEPDFCVAGRELYPGDKDNGMASNVTFIGWSSECEGSAWVPRSERDGVFDLFVQIDYEGKAGYKKDVVIIDGFIGARFSHGSRVNLCIDGDADSYVTWPDDPDDDLFRDGYYSCGPGVAVVHAVTTACNIPDSPTSVKFEFCLDDRAYLEPKTPVWGPNRAPVVPKLWGEVFVSE